MKDNPVAMATFFTMLGLISLYLGMTDGQGIGKIWIITAIIFAGFSFHWIRKAWID